MIINANFSEPLDVSTLTVRDRFNVVIVNSSLFVSADTGLRLANETSLMAKIPK